MKDKILDIVAEHCVGWKNCEALTEKLFDLYSVSKSFTAEQVVNELKENETLDDAISFFTNTK